MTKIALKSKTLLRGLVTYLLLASMSGLADDGVDDGVIEAELDAYWRNVSSTLARGDFESLVKTYHPDAILVSESLGTSYLISQALKRWKPGILDTQVGKTTALVEFRISERLFSDSTSHEKGIFHYKSGPGENIESTSNHGSSDASKNGFADVYIHFEALLIKNGDWTSMMEYQQHEATLSQWESAQVAR